MIRFQTSSGALEKTTLIINQAWSNLIKRNDLGFWQLPMRNANWDSAQKFADKLKNKNKKFH